MWDCHRPANQLASFKRNVKEFIDKISKHFQDFDLLIGEIPGLEGIPFRAFGTGMEGFALIECPCAYYNLKNYSFKSRINLYNEFLRSLITRKGVIITSILREEELKDWPPKMTSKLDAFHPSKWAQQYFALKIYQDLKKE